MCIFLVPLPLPLSSQFFLSSRAEATCMCSPDRRISQLTAMVKFLCWLYFLYCCCLRVHGPLKAGPAATRSRGQKWGLSGHGLHTRLVRSGWTLQGLILLTLLEATLLEATLIEATLIKATLIEATHLCLNIAEIVPDKFNRILDFTRKYGKNNVFQWKYNENLNSILSSCGFKVIVRELDLLRLSGDAKKRLLKKSGFAFYSIRALNTLTVVDSGSPGLT